MVISLLCLFPSFLISQRRTARSPQAPLKSKTQAAKHHQPTSAATNIQSLPPLLELNQRLITASQAQQSGDLDATVAANRRLLGYALRQMADLRVIEDATAQAVEIYKRSLEFEDVPRAHDGLAVAYLRIKMPSGALAEAEKLTFADPSNARAWNIKGKAWMLLKDYRAAAQNLARSISLEGNMEAAYSLATCLLALKEKNKAELVFHDMVNVSGGDRASLHILFGRAYRDAGESEDAVREFRRALEIDPKAPHAHYFIGLLRLMQNEWSPLPEIRAQMEAELKYHPRDYLANYILGVFTSNDKQYAVSDAYLHVSVAEQPASPEPFIYLGLNQFSQGHAREAETLLRHAIELTGADEARSHYQIRKAYIALGRILIQSGRKEEAAQWMAKARAVQQLGLVESQQSVAEVFSNSGVGMGAVMPYISPETEERAVENRFVDATAHFGHAEFAKSNLTGKEAEAAAQQEKQLREILGTAYNDLGTAEARQKDFVQAAIHFKEAEKWNAEIPGLTRNLGFAAAKVNDHETVVRTLANQLQSHPEDNVARALLGISYFMTERFADAASTIAALGELAWRDPALAYPWAASLARLGKLKEAADVLESLEREQVPPQSLLLLAQLWNDLGDTPHAVADYRRALQFDPHLRYAHYRAGLAWLRSGKPDEAAKEFEAELAAYPEDANTKYNLGYVYLQQSQTDKAKELFSSVIAADPQHANAQYQLGKLLLDQGQVKEAIAHLEAAARLSPEIDYIHYQLQAAYRKDERPSDADRELQVYKEVKSKNRDKQLPEARPNP